MNAVECISQTNQYLPVLSAFGGSFVTGLFLYLINNTNKKDDEKKHHRELVLNTAFEHWKQGTHVAIEKMKSGQKSKTLPLDTYIIDMTVFSEQFSNKNITKENVIETIENVREITDMVADYYLKKNKKSQSATNQT